MTTKRNKALVLPDARPAIKYFCQVMSECEKQLNEAEWNVRKGEDKFWDVLWDHESLFTVLFGALGAILPIAMLFAIHLARGGTVF